MDPAPAGPPRSAQLAEFSLAADETAGGDGEPAVIDPLRGLAHPIEGVGTRLGQPVRVERAHLHERLYVVVGILSLIGATRDHHAWMRAVDRSVAATRALARPHDLGPPVPRVDVPDVEANAGSTRGRRSRQGPCQGLRSEAAIAPR